VKTADFDFDLPRERIADRPARPRDSARLLWVGDRLGDHHVRDLPKLLRPGDLMVLNDTRVIPARLRGRRGAAKVEATLHKRAGPGRWFAFARPAKRLRAGDAIDFGDGLAATVADKGPEGEVLLDFGLADAPLLTALEAAGEMPLPPYIPRPGGAAAADRTDYQTVYARRPGAVAAPTAGLHFTEGLFRALADAGVGRVFLTLHVGAGTFLPVRAERIEDHRMHSEWGEIGAAAAERINAARAAGGRIVAVGTTSLRLMESAADAHGRLQPFEGETDIFIAPGHPLRSADLLLTNFHLPRSTLFMLVCAFAGVARMKAAYAHAVREGYRFYSYGDACLLERAA
jgi:S-adenosylmethionine:tRNA ribosyltransferase-isomerase